MTVTRDRAGFRQGNFDPQLFHAAKTPLTCVGSAPQHGKAVLSPKP
jgi:hypothetical protein